MSPEAKFHGPFQCVEPDALFILIAPAGAAQARTVELASLAREIGAPYLIRRRRFNGGAWGRCDRVVRRFGGPGAVHRPDLPAPAMGRSPFGRGCPCRLPTRPARRRR